MPALNPTREQFSQFAKDLDSPVCMINLLKFRDRANYPENMPEAKEELTGVQAYMKYSESVQLILKEIGAKLVFSAPVAGFVIGEGDWDVAALVWYPSRRTFLDMTQRSDYQMAHHHREAGLLHQDLIATSPGEL